MQLCLGEKVLRGPTHENDNTLVSSLCWETICLTPLKTMAVLLDLSEARC